MKFRNNLPSEEEVKKTDMVDCLERLGLKPAKNSRNDFGIYQLSEIKQHLHLK